MKKLKNYVLTAQSNLIKRQRQTIEELRALQEENNTLARKLRESLERIRQTEKTIITLMGDRRDAAKSKQRRDFESRTQRRRKPGQRSRNAWDSSTRVGEQGAFATSTRKQDGERGRRADTTALDRDAALARDLERLGGKKKKKTLKRKRRKKRGTMKKVPK